MYVICVQERSVRLFDRGELNDYKDDLRFLLILASCCRAASFPASVRLEDLERYLSTYSSLVSDITQLLARVMSQSVDSVFRPVIQSRLREDLIAVIRQYVAARWLRRVLISNNITVDDMQCIQCTMLDASKRWFWLREFVDVL